MTLMPNERRMVQVVGFEIEGGPISVSARDAGRLVEQLRADGSECRGVADKIENAAMLGGSGRVSLSIGEDECTLRALEKLSASGDFLRALTRLERAIRDKIARES